MTSPVVQGPPAPEASQTNGHPAVGRDATDATGVLLVNLGTPDAPTPAALYRYLRQFLSDPRVVSLPRALWLPILHGIVLRNRPPRSAALYATVWTAQGSPLLATTEAQVDAVTELLQHLRGAPIPVRIGMRYGAPSVAGAVTSLVAEGCRRIVVLPLFPQYSVATTASVGDALDEALAALPRDRTPEVEIIADYHDHPGYIDALAATVREAWEKEGPSERLLISFHGTPVGYRDRGDPYYDQCQATGRALAAALDLPPEPSHNGRWELSFQSRFGPSQWLTPYTDLVLEAWGAGGVSTVDVICPGFSADCLETLEEIAATNAEGFVARGGTRLRYIPALNTRPDHVAALADIVLKRL